jgi:hypothetical protein
MSSCAEPRRASGGVAGLADLARLSIRSLPQGLMRALLLPSVFGLLAPLQAQADASEVEASPYQQCLSPGVAERSLPAYPENRLRRKEGAVFEVELRFVDRRRGPQVRVLRDANDPNAPRPDPEFVTAAQDYAGQLRVPCLPDGEAIVSLVQRFQFVPVDGGKVTVGRVADADQAERSEQTRCLRHVDDQRRPRYPASALSRELQGTVVAKITFTAPDQPPEVKILTEPETGRFGAAVTRFAQGLRMPCQESGVTTVRQLFRFQLPDHRRVWLRDIDLPTFVGALVSFPSPAFIDTNAMRCPFDLQLTYLAPHLSNLVREVGEQEPARRPLLDWLREAELYLPPDRANLVLGDTMKLQVPCVKLDVPRAPP